MIGADVHLYVCILYSYIYYVTPKSLKAVDSPFQTLAVDFSLIYVLALPLRAPETLSLLSKSRISLFNAHLALFVRRMT